MIISGIFKKIGGNISVSSDGGHMLTQHFATNQVAFNKIRFLALINKFADDILLKNGNVSKVEQ